MRDVKRAGAGVLLPLVTGILLWAPAAHAALIVVNTTEDLATGASCASGSSTCTLREAIVTANEDTGALFDEIILLFPGRYELTIPGSGEDFGAEGDLDVLGNLKIRGLDPETTIIDANGIDRVFDVWDSYLLLDAMTITGGVAPDPEASGGTGGGGIRASGTDLELKEVHVIGNRATRGGGLLAASPQSGAGGSVVIRDSYFLGNVIFAGSTNSWGPAIYSSYVSSLTLTRSTVSENRCSSDVAICPAAAEISNCVADDAVDVENSTVAGNQGHGFLTHNCDTTIRHATIAENGVYGLVFSSFDGTDTLTMRSTIVANNGSSACALPSGVHDVGGGKNLATDGSCGLNELLGDLPLTDPQLGPLGAFVSDAPSYHPEPGSPVIDVSGACAATGDDDQDGFERPDGDVSSGGTCDIGSIEVLACDMDLDAQLIPGTYGSGTWTACHNLRASSVEVLPGSTVTARARFSITLGNGFSLGSGATFSAELDRTAGWVP